jgi:hypothetical protein
LKGLELILLLLISSLAWAVPTPPAAVPGGYQAGADLKAFADRGEVSYFVQIAGVEETAGRQFQDYALGSYYHLFQQFKVGAFYERAYGLRHDEDWALNSGHWAWVDSNSRGENIFILDATAKTLLPLEDWVFEFKSRYLINTFNDNRTLLLRPGLTYFYVRSGQLIADFFVQYEWDLALNYGVQPVDEKWLYFGSLYHFSRGLDVGPFAAIHWQSWGRPQAYAEKGGASYTITTQTTTLGLTALFHF